MNPSQFMKGLNAGATSGSMGNGQKFNLFNPSQFVGK